MSLKPSAVLLIFLISSSISSTTSYSLSSPFFLSSTLKRNIDFRHATIKTSLQSTTEKSSDVVEQKSNSLEKPGTAKLDTPWGELGFEFRETKSHIKLSYKNGKWEAPELVQDPYIKIHIGSTALHYGQSAFEGLKAFAHEDGSVKIFRPEENAKRLQSSCERIMMAKLPIESFVNACNAVVKDNIAYVPPYGSGGSLYLRPLLFGSGARIGLQPADEYTFLVMVIPVGGYYAGGAVDAIIVEDYDRAAPKGVGQVKVAGNYAADLLPGTMSKKNGYQVSLYLDAGTRTTIEEFSTSNFAGINYKEKKYVTPRSSSVLPSITNKCLMKIVEEFGYAVEEREISVEELGDFDEVLAIGTAVVVTPVGSITKGDKVYKYGKEGEVAEITQKLYNRVREIQDGIAEDIYGWTYNVN